MCELKAPQWLFCPMFLIASTFVGLVPAGSAFGDVQADMVFLIDGSQSVAACPFTFEKDAIANLICGGACNLCADSSLPHDGSIAVSVIQFAGQAPQGAFVHIGLSEVDSQEQAQSLCTAVQSIGKFFEGGSTPLAAGLNKTRDVFQASTTGATQRLVVILSDVDEFDDIVGAAEAAEILRTMGIPGELGESYNGPPAAILALRFYASAYNYSCGDSNLDEEPLAVLANAPGFCPPIHDPSQTMGDFVCRSLCWGQPHTADDIHAFIDLVHGGLCSMGAFDVSIASHPDPQTVDVGDPVTFVVEAEADHILAHYQWQKDGTDIHGAVNPTFSIAQAALCDAGEYRCTLSGPCNSVTSQTAMLTIATEESDCNGNGVADVCEVAPYYGWTGTLPLVDASDERGNGIAADASGGVAYTGVVRQYNDISVDFDLTDTCDSRALAYWGGLAAFTTMLAPTEGGNQYAWTDVLDENSTDEQNCAVAFGPDGNVYVTGSVQNAETYRVGILVRSCDRTTGAVRWSYSIWGDGNTEAFGCAVDSSGNVVITGYFAGMVDFDPTEGEDFRTPGGNQDIFVSKFTSAGEYLWTRTVAGSSGSGGEGRSLAVDSAHRIFVTGKFSSGEGPCNFDPSGSGCYRTSLWWSEDIFVMALDDAGAFQWVETFGGTDSDQGNSIIVTDDGIIYVVGSFHNRMSLDPAHPFDPENECNPALEDYCHLSHGGRDVFLVKLQAGTQSRTYLWSRSVGGIYADDGSALALDLNENALVTGFFDNTVDFNPANSAGCPADPACRSTAGSTDIFLTQWNSDGSYAWTYALGGSGSDAGLGIAVDSIGDVWLTGFFGGAVDFDPTAYGNDTRVALGSTDVFVTRLRAPGYSFSDCNGNALADVCEDECWRKGDVTKDGLVDGRDIQAFVELITSSSLVCWIDFCRADINDDHELDLVDVPLFVGLLLEVSKSRLLDDCNTNGIADANDIANQTSEDCNKNFIPDECDIDPADSDGTELVSNDLNANGIPDECEPDCNENGVPDDKDIADETSNDVNGNDVPDECELDCNQNGVPDSWDVLQQTSEDCNSNGRPDECEIDCNDNGVPDDCDVDPLDPDGNEEVSEDCNGNGRPDECDFTWPPPLGSLDCNENGIPDECDIADCEEDPACEDCNENGFPDACDIAVEISLDENENGIPDECEGENLMGGGGMMQQESMLLGESEAYWTAWGEYFDWARQQDWGPNSSVGGSDQFRAMADKMRELGLPVRNRWHPIPASSEE